ncbi:MAG: AMP-binding protein [Syntrophaceae bacterium]|nr:AMP-binding protein [Syntrophaceae bacterium]
MTITIQENRSIFGVIENICEKYPHKPAIIYLGEKFSYSKLRDLVRRFAGALSDLGVRVNDKVMIYIANCPQFLIAYFGIQEIGAIPVPVSPIYTPFELEYMINDSGAETIICQDTNFHYVTEVFEKNKFKRIIVTNLVDLLPWWKRIIGEALDKVPKGVVQKTNQVYFFSDIIRRFPNQPPEVTINPEEQLASILYTGGTTGSPRGVPSSQAKMLCSLKDLGDLTKNHIPEAGNDVLLVATSLFHMMGQEAVLGLGLGKGISVVLMPIPQVDAILDAIQMYKVTTFVGVPALYRMILGNERINSYNLSSLKYCWCGGDVLPSDVFKRWYEKFNIPLYQIYGTTEMGSIALSPLDKFPVIGSIGLPIPSKQIKIVDSDTLEELPANKVGELLVTSEYGIQRCYWNKPEETAECFVERDGKTWNLTNDYVQADENGNLFYVDRSADIIKYKGYRVSCSEIEAILQSFKVVKEACVIGVPDPAVGELIKAIVVLKENTRGVDASELIKWCREKLAPYKIPDYIEFRDMLPKSKVGKLLRREIREEERRRWLRRK